MTPHSNLAGSFLHGWQRVAFGLLAVPTILVGLLAMHTLTVSHVTRASDIHVAAMVDGESHNESVSAPTKQPIGCGGLCAGDHDMLSTACILALLVSVLIVTIQLLFVRWRMLRVVALRFLESLATLAPPVPPSLHALSISRT